MVGLNHSEHMGELIYEAQPSLDSRWIQSQDEVDYPERVLQIIERLHQTWEPLSIVFLF